MHFPKKHGSDMGNSWTGLCSTHVARLLADSTLAEYDNYAPNKVIQVTQPWLNLNTQFS